MELWIRSQDKETLILANHLDIYCVDEEENIYAIEECGNDLGNYISKERALEVLDEIQNILMPKCIINSKSMKFSKPYEENGMVLMDCNADARLEQLSTIVYEMPEK